MAIIPENGDPTLNEMRRQMEILAAQEPKREYLGVSGIGESCSRKLWYGLHGYPSSPIESAGLMAIEDGHRTEDLVAERLRLVPGLKLWTTREDGAQFGFSSLDGKYKGHYDGIIMGLLQSPKTPHVWECKCVNIKKFEKFQSLKSVLGEKAALKTWDYVYYCQAQVYMHKENLTRHYLTVATPGGRDIDSCRTEFDLAFALALDAKAARIVNAKEPPQRIGSAEDFACKWCRYKNICHD